ncbi:MAG: beta strand repeat-containing protein, partial [Rubrobacteraceae bacterium]
ATVTLRVGGMIWFVDENATAAGDGRLSSPFDTLSAFNAVNNGNANNPASGDNIFLYESSTNYGGGVTLLANQRLIGQDASQSLATITSLTRPSGSAAFPTMSTVNSTKSIITNASGNGITLGAGNTIRGLTVGNTSGSGIKGTNVNAATMGVDVAVSGTNGGAAVNISGGNGAVNYNGTISNTFGGAVSVMGRTGGTMNFGGNINATGGGLNVQNNTGSTISFSGANKTLNTGNSIPVILATNTGSTINFTNGNLDIDTTTGSFIALSGGTLNVSGSNNTVNSTGFTALDLSDITSGTSGITFADISSGGGFVNASISNVSGGDVALNGGALSGASQRAFNVSGGNANITYAGTISNSHQGIRVANSAGTVTFSGNNKTLDTGSTPALTLDNNDAGTVRFTNGGLAITTTSATGFNAINGATAIEVSGAGNTISSGTGTALKVENSNIGSNGLNFRSISANGAPNGIVLDNTGTSGGLSVTGTTGTAGSGGTIRNTAGADGATSGIGVYLNNTRNVSLSNMQINDHPNFAVRGNGVAGFTMAGSVVSGTNGTNVAVDEASVAFDGLTGSASFTNTSVSGGVEDNFRVLNGSGTLDRIVFDNVNVGANGAFGNHGITLTSSNSAVMKATVRNSTFTGARGSLFHMDAKNTSTADLVFTNNTLSNNHPDIVPGGGGVTVIMGGTNTANPTMTYSITDNTFRDAKSHGLLVSNAGGVGTMSGEISGNQIGVAATANSGSKEGSGLAILTLGGGTHTASVTNNQIRQYNNQGILLQAGENDRGGQGALNATVTGNTISNPGNLGTLAMNGIHLNSGTVDVPIDSHQVCTQIGGAGALANTLTGSGNLGGTDFRLRQRQQTTVRLPGYTGGATNTSAVVSFVQGNNGGTPSGSATVNSPPGGGFVGGASCPQP